jgi:hypothetical protein
MPAPGVVESRIRRRSGVAGAGFALRAEIVERFVARALACG